MKRLVAVVATAAFISASALATDTLASTLHYGVHGGLNFGTESGGASTSGQGSETGAVAGVGVQYGLLDYLALQAELNFIQKGLSVTSPVSETTKLNYLELPVVLRGQITVGGVKPYLLAGPKIGYLLSASAGGNDVKSFYNSLDFGFDFGLGVSVPVSDTFDVFVEGRYAVGIADVVTDAKPSVTNNGFQVQVGLWF